MKQCGQICSSERQLGGNHSDASQPKPEVLLLTSLHEARQHSKRVTSLHRLGKRPPAGPPRPAAPALCPAELPPVRPGRPLGITAARPAPCRSEGLKGSRHVLSSQSGVCTSARGVVTSYRSPGAASFKDWDSNESFV